MNKTIPLVVMAWAFFAELCSGAIVPIIARVYNFPGTGYTNSYTIATNKFLMIRQITSWGTNINPSAGIDITEALFETFIGRIIPAGVNQTITYNPPIVIPGGHRLTAEGATVEMPVDYYVIGFLVDASDLYAAIPNAFESIQLAGAAAQMGLRLDSPRPAKIAVEESEDLVAWTPREDIVAAASADRCLYSLSAVSLEPTKFYKAKVRALR